MNHFACFKFFAEQVREKEADRQAIGEATR
jgi:hypothetical protein